MVSLGWACPDLACVREAAAAERGERRYMRKTIRHNEIYTINRYEFGN